MTPEHAPPGLREEQAAILTPAGEDHLYEMTNVYPRTSGLPMTVWISPRGRARHDVRVKVCRVPGNRMVPDDMAVVSVHPQPALLAGDLDAETLRAVQAWIDLNRDVLVELWNGELDGVEPAQRLRRV